MNKRIVILFAAFGYFVALWRYRIVYIATGYDGLDKLLDHACIHCFDQSPAVTPFVQLLMLGPAMAINYAIFGLAIIFIIALLRGRVKATLSELLGTEIK